MRLAALALVLLACDGTSPSESGRVVYQIATQWGTVSYAPAPCDAVGVSVIGGHLAAGVERAISERGAEGITLAGLSVVGVPANGVWAGRYTRATQTAEYVCGSERVLAHEVGHYLADELGLWCHATVWHGLDMRCREV